MKTWFTAIMLFSQLFLEGQSESFIITGRIKGLDSEKLDLIIYDESYPKGYRRDSIPVTGESFSFTSDIDKLLYVTINPGVERVVKRAGRGYFPAKSSLLQCFIFPGAKINFSGKITDYVDAYPSGDVANNELADLNREVCPLMNRSVNLSVRLANKLVTDSLEMMKLYDSIERLDREVVDIKQQFVGHHPSSVAAIWLLSDMMVRSQVDGEQATTLFQNMSQERLGDILYYKEVEKRVEGILNTAIGKKSPGITSQNTFDGKKFDLNSLKGKYVVLDFWGTWCGPCIAGMPRMKEYLDKYRDKMAIVGIAQESDNGDRWRKFLADKPEYSWPQVLSRKEEDYILKFSVAGFPTKIILDPGGIILARFVGEDEEMYSRLDEILK